MKNIMRNTIIYTSIFLLSIMTSFIFWGNSVKAAELGNGSYSEEYTDIDEYYGKKAPTFSNGVDGVEYLFAGWYEDESCEVSYVREEGETLEKYYAKFVPNTVLSVKAQHGVTLHNIVLEDEDTGSIRFVTSTDSNNYNEVGLHVEGTIGSHTLDRDYVVGTIYTYLYVVGDTNNDQSNPVAASTVFETESAKYFAPHAFKINYTQFDDDFTITPYWITPDGVRVDGVARTRNMIDNLEDNSYAEVNGRAYYTSNDLSTIYNTYVVNEETFVGTEESPTEITLLKNHVSMTAEITIKGSRNILIQNRANTDVTLSRTSEDGESVFTAGNMFVINGGSFLQLGATDSAHTGALIVDGETSEAVGYRTVYVKASGKFVLQKNATMQNAFSTKSGAALVNIGTSDLYGNMLNNTSNNSSSSAYGAGAILQGQNSGTLTIHSGTYEGNRNTGTYGAGGVIGTQIINTDGELAGPITIVGGTFSNNSAAYGAVVSSYTTNKVTISGGTFTSNKAIMDENSVGGHGGVVYLFANATLDITGGEFNSNQADAYGGVISTQNVVGEINITSGEFKSNYAATYGGVVSVARRGVLNISGGTFLENSAGSYGGVISTTQGNTTSNGATINITNGEFTANTGTPDGGVIYVNKSGTLAIDGGTFSENSATTNGGVISTAEGFRTDTDAETGTETITALPISVTINAGTFASNSATTDGGVVYLNKYGSITIDGGIFNQNIGTTNGGVISTAAGSSNDDGPVVTINTGAFTLNSALSYGGVICLDKYGSLIVNNGSFEENNVTNTSSYGGVIATKTGTESEVGAEITINDGTFTSNSGTYGGVVFVHKYGKVDILDGYFYQNSAKNGGVIGTVTGTSATLCATVNIIDGEFTSNEATQYGGVAHLGAYGEINIDNGEFTSNSADSSGGVISTATASSDDAGVNITIDDGNFQSNSAPIGGVIYLMNCGTLAVTKGTFEGNAATGYGAGVVYICQAKVTISNATMTGNCASEAKAAYYGGGAITLHRDATVTLANCSIYGNTHAGALTDTDKNTNGCDIAFSGGNTTSRTQTLILQDESFNGIIGHVSNVVKAKHQVKFSDGTEKALEAYNTRYTVDYDVPTLVKKDYYSVLLTSDMHYTTNYTQTEYNIRYLSNGANASAVSGPMFGYTQDERMEIILSDINDYATKNESLDAVMLLGDLSIDNKGYANLHEDFLKTFKDNYLSQLKYPWYAIAGNHDSYTADEWEKYMGMKRQYSVEIGNAVFIMLDTFEAAHATTASGSSYVGIDTEFLQAELDKEEYADKIIFLCAHYYHEGKDTTNDAALQAVLEAEKADKDRIVCLFRGHSHNSRIITDQTSMAGIPIVDIGGYAYNPDGVDGEYNVFQEKYAWGYQVLEWDENEVHLYHVKPARTYTDSSTTYNYAGATESELTISLK